MGVEGKPAHVAGEEMRWLAMTGEAINAVF
jgi:hypothetical protein